MKRSLLLVLSTLLFIALPQTVSAGSIEHVLDLLKQAKESDQPLPLLEKAHKELADSNPTPKGTALIGNRKARVGMATSGHEHKQKAMEAVGEAIKVAKEGGETKPKIENAISHVHSLDDLKH